MARHGDLIRIYEDLSKRREEVVSQSVFGDALGNSNVP